MTASNLQSVAVDVVDRIASEASALVSGLFMRLLMEVVYVLCHQRDLLASST